MDQGPEVASGGTVEAGEASALARRWNRQLTRHVGNGERARTEVTRNGCGRGEGFEGQPRLREWRGRASRAGRFEPTSRDGSNAFTPKVGQPRARRQLRARGPRPALGNPETGTPVCSSHGPRLWLQRPPDLQRWRCAAWRTGWKAAHLRMGGRRNPAGWCRPETRRTSWSAAGCNKPAARVRRKPSKS